MVSSRFSWVVMGVCATAALIWSAGCETAQHERQAAPTADDDLAVIMRSRQTTTLLATAAPTQDTATPVYLKMPSSATAAPAVNVVPAATVSRPSAATAVNATIDHPVVEAEGVALISTPQPEIKPQGPAPKAAPNKDPLNRRVAMFYPTGHPDTSAVRIEKVVPREVWIHKPFKYELVVTNTSDQILHDVVLRDKLGEHLKIADSAPAGRPGENGFVMWPLGSLKPGASKTVQVTALATGGGTVGSWASVSYNSLLSSEIAVLEPRLKVTKTGPNEVLRCDNIGYRFEVANTGTVPVEDIRVGEQLPDGLSTEEGQQNLEFNVGTLVPGQSRSFTAMLRVSKAGRFEGQTKAVGRGGVSALSDPFTVWVRQPVLKMDLSGPTRTPIGRIAVCQVTVTNAGDGVARETTIEQIVPPRAKLIETDPAGNVVDLGDGIVRWELGELEPGSSKTVNLAYNADHPGVFRTTAIARAYCATQVSAWAQTQYVGVPAILLEVVDLEDPIEVGQTETYEITATNQGSAEGTNIKIVCALEDTYEYASSMGATQATVRDGVISFAPVARLAPGKSATWRVTAKAVRGGDARFKVTMTSDQLTRPVEESEATNLFE